MPMIADDSGFVCFLLMSEIMYLRAVVSGFALSSHKSWKWTIPFNERKLGSGRDPFSTSMIVGGRVDHQLNSKPNEL